MTFKKTFAIAMMAIASIMPATAQEVFSPDSYVGLGFNANTNHPLFSGSLRLTWEIGKPSDILGLNVGFGYRGFFDREPPREFLRHSSFSDYLLYSRENGETKHVRPVGGQIVIPAEVQLRLISLGEDWRLFVGGGAEYGIRLYQSHRYADYYGNHMLHSNSLSVYPMLGAILDMEDEGSLTLSLYMRHYLKQPMNYENLYDPDKFNARNYFGFQVTMAFHL
jgi:hypothetical protein